MFALLNSSTRPGDASRLTFTRYVSNDGVHRKDVPIGGENCVTLPIGNHWTLNSPPNFFPKRLFHPNIKHVMTSKPFEIREVFQLTTNWEPYRRLDWWRYFWPSMLSSGQNDFSNISKVPEKACNFETVHGTSKLTINYVTWPWKTQASSGWSRGLFPCWFSRKRSAYGELYYRRPMRSHIWPTKITWRIPTTHPDTAGNGSRDFSLSVFFENDRSYDELRYRWLVGSYVCPTQIT